MGYADRMARKRPCRICGRWFYPSPRAGDRQHVCSDPLCQQERHRRSCAGWHQSNPGYDRERRLVRRLRRDVAEAAQQGDPLRQICWEVARDAVGLEASVITQETAQVVVDFARDAVRRQQVEITRQLSRLPRPPPRDAFDRESSPG